MWVSDQIKVELVERCFAGRHGFLAAGVFVTDCDFDWPRVNSSGWNYLVVIPDVMQTACK